MRASLSAALAAGVLVLSGMTTAAQALPPLSDNARIQGEMTAGAVAYQIGKNCPTIGARTVRAYSRLNKLKSYARGLGYQDSDIDALGKDAVAKDKLNMLRDSYLSKNGVAKGDTDSYCRLGYAEIERESLTGWLLRAR